MGDYKFIWWEEYVSWFFWMIRWLECNFFGCWRAKILLGHGTCRTPILLPAGGDVGRRHEWWSQLVCAASFEGCTAGWWKARGYLVGGKIQHNWHLILKRFSWLTLIDGNGCGFCLEPCLDSTWQLGLHKINSTFAGKIHGLSPAWTRLIWKPTFVLGITQKNNSSLYTEDNFAFFALTKVYRTKKSLSYICQISFGWDYTQKFHIPKMARATSTGWLDVSHQQYLKPESPFPKPYPTWFAESGGGK